MDRRVRRPYLRNDMAGSSLGVRPRIEVNNKVGSRIGTDILDLMLLIRVYEP
jgi:hypothetical protein